MVSLESRSNYLEGIQSNPKLYAFFSLLNSEKFSVSNTSTSTEIDELYFGIVKAIADDNDILFAKLYAKISKRKVSKDSSAPFVNDDLLVFLLLLGVRKYKCEVEWLKGILSVRAQTDVTKTLQCLVQKDRYSHGLIPEVMVAFYHLIGDLKSSEETQLDAYNHIVTNPSILSSGSHLKTICSLRAYDIIVNSRSLHNPKEISELRIFEAKFKKRMKWVSWIIQWFIGLAVVYSIFVLVRDYPWVNEKIEELGNVFAILGFLGVSALGHIFPAVRAKFSELLMRSLGYPSSFLTDTSPTNQT